MARKTPKQKHRSEKEFSVRRGLCRLAGTYPASTTTCSRCLGERLVLPLAFQSIRMCRLRRRDFCPPPQLKDCRYFLQPVMTNRDRHKRIRGHLPAFDQADALALIPPAAPHRATSFPTGLSGIRGPRVRTLRPP